jgi:hypothetical protein
MTKKVAATVTTPLLESAIKELAFENQALVVGSFDELAKRFSIIREAHGLPAATISGMRYQLKVAFEHTGATARQLKPRERDEVQGAAEDSEAEVKIPGPIVLPLSDNLLIDLVAQRFGERAADCLRSEMQKGAEASGSPEEALSPVGGE